MDRLRTVVFSVYVALVTVFITVAWSPALIFVKRVPYASTRMWAKLALFGLRIICGVTYRIENAHLIPKNAAIVAANHHSMWETIVFFAILPKPVMVYKRELLKIPVYGFWAGRSSSIPVDRDAGAKAIRELTRLARERLAEGCQIVLFPEGTRVPYGERGPLQPGIAAVYALSNAPCVPAAHDSGRFWSFPGGLNSVKRPGVITLRFEEPIPAGMDRKAFVAELERRIDAGAADLGARRGSDSAFNRPEKSALA